MTRLKALPLSVWLLGGISLLNDAASDLLYPLVPIYLASVLMAGPRVLGLIEGCAEALAALLKLASGVLADAQGRAKPWIVVGYALASIARPLYFLAGSWPVILALRLSDRIGKGLRSAPRDALLAASVAPEDRGIAFGLHRAMDNAGAVIGPLAAAGLLALGMPIADIFLWSALPGALVILCALALPERVRAPKPRQSMRWSPGQLSPALRRYLVVLALFSLGNASNMFLLLRAHELGLSATHTALLWALTSFSATLLGTPLSALSDQWPRRHLITAGWLLYAALLLGMGLSDGQLLWPFFLSMGVYLAATEGAEKALVADLAESEHLGTAYGWYNGVLGLTLLPASLLFGTLWEKITPQAAFGFSAGCALLAVLLLNFWLPRAEAVPVSETQDPSD
ncbi:MAG: MFS transporter [Gammaproteobacteria bacterium]|nr:MFS transporter [Gammaproteobacteria bacterium]